MTVSELIALIGRLKPPLLHGLDVSGLRTVLKAAEDKSFAAGSIMLRQGYPARKLLLLLEGRACYTFASKEGRRLILQWNTAGKVLGVASLLSTPHNYFVSTEAVEDCRVLSWDRTTIRRLAGCYPSIWENIVETITLGAGAFVDIYASRTSDAAPRRVARALIDLAELLGRRNGNGIEVRITNEDLALTANVTLFTASRILNQWQRSGLVVKTRRKIVLRSPEALILHEV